MRVLVLTNLYPSPTHPARAPFNRQQFGALGRIHDVRVITPVAWTDVLLRRARLEPPTRASHEPNPHTPPVAHSTFYFTPKILRRAYGRFMVHSVKDAFRRAVDEFHPDVVLASWAYPDGWAGLRLAQDTGLPIVIKVHGSDVLCVRARSSRLAPTAEALRGADGVIAVSRHLAARVVNMGAAPERVHVVYNGVDRDLFKPANRRAAQERLGIAGPSPLLLFVGNLAEIKGLDVLIEALAELRREGLPFQCAILGAGPLERRLSGWIRTAGLSDQVRLAGACPLESLPTWYNAADLLVLPSRSEGIPNVLLEATACGTPFVATHVGGIPEIAPPDRLVPPGDPHALAEKLRQVLTPRQTQHDALPTWSPPFQAGCWDESARVLARVLESVVSARREPARIAA